MTFARIILGSGSAVIGLIASYALLNAGFPANWQPWVVTCTLLWLGLFTSTVIAHFGSPYQFCGVYLLALVLFHLGITIPDAFGWLDSINWESATAERWRALGGWCICLAMAAYGFGVALAMGAVPAPVTDRMERTALEQSRFQIGFECGLVLLAASGVLLAWTFMTVGNLLNFSRLDFFNGIGDTRGFGVALMAMPSAAIMLVICAQTATQRWVGGIAAALVLFILLLSGFRTSALYPLLVGVVLWHKLIGRIPKPLAIAAVVGVLFLIPIIATLRAAGPYKNVSTDLLKQSTADVSVAESLRTMGQTGDLVAEVIRLVPREDAYRFGSTYLEAMLRTLPNVGGNISVSQRESVAQSNFLQASRFSSLPPSDWLTYRLTPEKFGTGEGVGFTSIGEAYLNFGYAGVIIFFSVLGFLLARLDAANLKSSTFLLLFCCMSYWHLARTVRDDFSNWIKPTVFLTLMIVCYLLARRLYRRLIS